MQLNSVPPDDPPKSYVVLGNKGLHSCEATIVIGILIMENHLAGVSNFQEYVPSSEDPPYNQ